VALVVDGLEGDWIPTLEHPALDRAFSVNGTGARDSIIIPARGAVAVGLNLDAVVVGLPDLAPDVIVDGLAGTDGHQVFQRKGALLNQPQILPVQDGPPFEAAGAAAAAMVGGVGDGGIFGQSDLFSVKRAVRLPGQPAHN
jgi:hypothetical protein